MYQSHPEAPKIQKKIGQPLLPNGRNMTGLYEAKIKDIKLKTKSDEQGDCVRLFQ